jgi:hypothetical protein
MLVITTEVYYIIRYYIADITTDKIRYLNTQMSKKMYVKCPRKMIFKVDKKWPRKSLVMSKKTLGFFVRTFKTFDNAQRTILLI